MISCHTEPFSAFCKDLQLPGCDVHLYDGPNKFGGICSSPESLLSEPQPVWWETSNVYFLAGVEKGLQKRAADSDVLRRNMFTLDFDIRKELEKKGLTTGEEELGLAMNSILDALLADPLWQNFRYVVYSGNGMHVHYFGDFCDVVKEQWVAGMKDIFETIAVITPIPPDFGCGNAGRIMRMPGSWNVKDPANKKPVTIEAWMPTNTMGSMQFVQERGKMILARQEEVKAAERAEFAAQHPDGGSDVIDLINAIPIEQVAQQLMGVSVKNIKKDGGMRFQDEKGVERGFFKHHQHNIIVHEGTSLFEPPSGIGYNPLGLVKAVKKCDASEAIQWFAERSSRVRELRKAERDEWLKGNQSHDVELYEQRKSTLPPQ